MTAATTAAHLVVDWSCFDPPWAAFCRSWLLLSVTLLVGERNGIGYRSALSRRDEKVEVGKNNRIGIVQLPTCQIVFSFLLFS